MNSSCIIVGIGASAGGLGALKEFFASLEPVSNAAFVVINHLPSNYSTRMDAILGKITSMPVRLLELDTLIVPGSVYVLPGHLRVTINDDVLLTRDRTASEVINTAIDEFFFSLADEKESQAIAIVLSGMGKDGADGALAVHEHGGIVMVQDPTTTEYRSMPVAAIRADDPVAVVKPSELALRLNEILAFYEISEVED